MLRLSASKFPPAKRQNSDYDALERRGYRFGRRIGKGSYGHVVIARYEDRKRGKRIDLACKCVAKDKAPKDFLDKFFPREIDILRRIHHENIISIHSILQSGSTVFIFMRWAERGDLLDYVQKNSAIGESHACLWFYQMVSAIRYLHSLDYAHRDLKCENILISRRMNVKIADFGFTRKCSDDQGDKIMSETFCGSAGNFILSFFGAVCILLMGIFFFGLILIDLALVVFFAQHMQRPRLFAVRLTSRRRLTSGRWAAFSSLCSML